MTSENNTNPDDSHELNNTSTETDKTGVNMGHNTENNPKTEKSENETDSSDSPKTETNSADSTQSAEQKTEAKTDAKTETEKKKKKARKPVYRDEAMIEASLAALRNLQAEEAKASISDKQSIERMITDILALREVGVSYNTIYKTLRETAKLRISLNTFVVYVQAAISKERGENEAKTVKISVPVEHKDKIEQIIKGAQHGSSIACTFFDNTGKKLGVMKIGESATSQQIQNN